MTGELAEQARGAEILLRGYLIDLFCVGQDEDEDDEPDTTEPIEACIEACTCLFMPKSKSKKKKKRQAEEADVVEAGEREGEEAPIDVLVDAIIGLLEKSGALLRAVANQAFALLSGSVQESTVELILKVCNSFWSSCSHVHIVQQLERRDPSELLDDDEEAEEDDEMGVDEEEESNSTDSAGDDDENDEPDLELRRKVEEAIRSSGIEAATGDSDESEEEIMDDEQMMAIDSQLAEIFKARANEKRRKGRYPTC